LDNEKRLRLEQQAARGQQAKAVLSFFAEFEQQQKERLWKAAQKSDTRLMTALVLIALTTGEFKNYLQTIAADGMIAEKDLQEDTKNG